MKTVFKEGMKVYDQVNFPGKEGVIIDTNKNNKLNLLVKFDSVNYLYTLKGIYLGCNGTPTLSTKPYEIEFQGFEQKAPAITYEEALDWLKKNSKDRVIYADEAYINEEYERAFEALKKLVILRDYYNEGWQPDWSTKNSMRFCIRVRNNKITTDNNSDINEFNTVLVFTDYTIRDKFLEEQRELLEIAKPLL